MENEMKYYLNLRISGILTVLLLLTFSGCSSDAETKSSNPLDAPDFTLDSVTGENGLLGNLVRPLPADHS
jgi:hypothetical protein